MPFLKPKRVSIVPVRAMIESRCDAQGQELSKVVKRSEENQKVATSTISELKKSVRQSNQKLAHSIKVHAVTRLEHSE